MMQTALAERIGCRYPIFSAPMAGGGTTPELAAAVSEAGGLGFLAAAYLQPPQIHEAAAAVRARTAKPFGINLFAPLPRPEPPADSQAALARLAAYHQELDLPEPA